ncbi:MAG: hypothetical protein COA96_15395 [SAR86 cluster bacterium]|uniref:HAD family hydrolase n=1 Tax=SAR86 cluster bacterium TaxID=2030880 RepID=A0A2A5APG2_9GAMM|nr:MAG: hypothetical protein COA96_15395 [SAR86 cluster bacterium]
MNNDSTFECVLWDFGDTIADQGWMLKSLPDVPNWSELFVEKVWNGAWGQSWFKGELSSIQLSELLSELVDLEAGKIFEHMELCSRDIVFFKNAFFAVKELNFPQAIVTVNPDLFSSVVEEEYSLQSYFDTIVTSWEQKTLDKSVLCDKAMSMLGSTNRKKALLIDNIEENIKHWELMGGRGYHFQNDELFGYEMSSLLGIRASTM